MIYLTLDCESIGSGKGPLSIDNSSKSISSLVKVCEENALPLELFITPKAAKENRQLLLNLPSFVKLSLHLHLPVFLPEFEKQKIELANLRYQRQFEILKQAKLIFEETLNQSPIGFRAGMGSANHDTFKALKALEINQGSSTVPGLVNKKFKVDWRNAPTSPYSIETEFGTFKEFPCYPTDIENIKDFKPLQGRDYLTLSSHNFVDFSQQTKFLEFIKKVAPRRTH